MSIIARFNNPTGSVRAERAVVRRFTECVDGAPAGSAVRVTTYSFGLAEVVDSLIAAAKRDVQVQVLIDPHSRNRQTTRLQLALHRQKNGSLARFTRGRGKVLHSKVWSIGMPSGDSLVWVGSQNLSTFSTAHQWQDMLEIANEPETFDLVRDLFDEQRRGKPEPFLSEHYARHLLQAYPFPQMTADTDPLMSRLRVIRLADDRAEIDLALHAFNGRRGMWLADELVKLHRHGHQMRALLGVHAGRQVVNTLTRAGVPVRRGVWAGSHIHHKLMLAAVGSAHYVWTGSNNWGDNYLREEIDLRTRGAGVWCAYTDHFDYLWKKAA